MSVLFESYSFVLAALTLVPPSYPSTTQVTQSHLPNAHNRIGFHSRLSTASHKNYKFQFTSHSNTQAIIVIVIIDHKIQHTRFVLLLSVAVWMYYLWMSYIRVHANELNWMVVICKVPPAFGYDSEYCLRDGDGTFDTNWAQCKFSREHQFWVTVNSFFSSFFLCLLLFLAFWSLFDYLPRSLTSYRFPSQPPFTIQWRKCKRQIGRHHQTSDFFTKTYSISFQKHWLKPHRVFADLPLLLFRFFFRLVFLTFRRNGDELLHPNRAHHQLDMVD